MTPFYKNLLQKTNAPKKCEPLKKEKIVALQGGDIHGERIFLVVNLGRESGYAVYDARVKGNRQSQRYPAHPEGWLWLKSDLHRNNGLFRYDIADSKCKVRLFEYSYWSTSRINYSWRFHPAVILQPRPGSEEEAELVMKAKDTEARGRLWLALQSRPEYISTVDELVAEHLGLTNSPDGDPVSRLLRRIPDLDGRFADDLRAAILAEGSSSPHAAAA